MNSTKIDGKARVPVIVVVAVLLAIVTIIILFLPAPHKRVNEEKFIAIDARLKQMEDRFVNIEWFAEKLTRLEAQSKKNESFMARFEKSDSSVLLKIELLEKKLETMQHEVKTSMQSSEKIKSVPVQISTKKSGTQLHQVRAGETLYGISHQYGLTIDELLRLNPSISSNTIYTGQKLNVR